MQITKELIDNTHHQISQRLRTTALDYSIELSEKTGVNVWLKKEYQQFTGSFKLRGALSCINQLSQTQKDVGVITASSGNHGLGVAMAGKITGTKVTVFLPANTSKVKLTALQHLNANVIVVDGDVLVAEQQAAELAKEKGCYYVSPYNDPYVIAGQATLAMEIHQQLPNADTVFISVGGGGLISGIGSYYQENKLETEIVGCWPENAPALLKCLEEGKIIEIEEQPTLSESTAGGVEPESITFPIAQKVVNTCYTVSETEIGHAMYMLAKYEREIVEGSAGVAMAALMQQAEQYKGKNVVVVLCGKNIGFDKWLQVIKQYEDD
ncbi:threonine/serine dehydratase [Zooshikella ganghwensis]|uniref:threonine/serine dehydratase n=1 Tax=Zooshikella ganghwensis TaxID=202772 RepID=UPI000413ADA2|nr:threonine/serine dehydratase [Zooshikella ganghwensis]